MKVTVRAANASDLPAILEIEQQAPTAAHWRRSDYEAALSDSRHLLLAAEGEDAQVLGFIVASTAAQEWELENIAVTPAVRRRGIGSALIIALIARAQMAGALEIRQEIRVSNLAAQRLGQAAGFEQEGRRRGYYRNPEEDALLFKYLVKRP